ncbi:flagellar biosynthesis protein FliQ [bacterium]|nr:flagellar biosynthesis protein FliQ [bacterium]
MESAFLDEASRAVTTTLLLATPVLIVSLVLGVLVGILQAVTSVQEQTLSFVPKIFAVAAVLILLAGWMQRTMDTFAVNIFGNLSSFIK